MAGGAWIQIRDSIDHSSLGGRARVTGSRLHVNAFLSGAVALVVQVTENTVVPATPELVPIAAERDDLLAVLPEADGDWVHLRTNNIGALWIAPAPGSIISLSVANFEGELSGVTVNSATGIPTLAVRDDDLSQRPAHVTNGDYIQLHSDSRGALWVRDFVPTDHLSGSTNGRPIQITGTTTGTAVVLHTATATVTEIDKVWIWITNTSAVQETVTIEFGTAGAGFEIDFKVPANDAILAVAGAAIGGAAGQSIEAFATTGSVLNAFGHIERQLTP